MISHEQAQLKVQHSEVQVELETKTEPSVAKAHNYIMAGEGDATQKN